MVHSKWNTSTEASLYQQLITKSNPCTLTERVLFLLICQLSINQLSIHVVNVSAEHYYACSVSDTYSSVDVIKSTDVDGILQLEGFPHLKV